MVSLTCGWIPNSVTPQICDPLSVFSEHSQGYWFGLILSPPTILVSWYFDKPHPDWLTKTLNIKISNKLILW